MTSYRYFAPKSLEDDLNILDEFGEETIVLGRGVDSVPQIQAKQIRPEIILNISNPELSNIKSEGRTFSIGAMTTWRDIEIKESVTEKARILAEAARLSGTASINPETCDHRREYSS